MKKVLCIVAILAVAACADASVKLFVTPASAGFGLNEVANHNTATFSSCTSGGASTGGSDFSYSNLGGSPGGPNPGLPPPTYTGGFSVGDGITHAPTVALPLAVNPGFPAYNSDGSTALNPVEISQKDFGYIWFAFQNEVDGVKIKGLGITIYDVTAGGGVAPASALGPTYYYQNDRNSGAGNYRWDGQVTQPGQPEFHNNPQVLVGVTSMGIRNARANPENFWNMADYQAKSGATNTTTVALLGALDPVFRSGHTYEIAITPGDNGIEYDTGVAGTHVSGFFKFVPEPASLLLMGLAGLILRRR
jgi:hypothetical protein